MEQNSQGLCNPIHISTLAELIIRSADKIRFDNNDKFFLAIRDDLIKDELANKGRHPVYHLQFCPDMQYVDAENRGRTGVYYLWRRSDWDLAEEKLRKDKAASDSRVEQHNNNTEMFKELCVCIGKAMATDSEDELVKTLASVITAAKNKTLAEFYGVKKETMDKVWN